MDCLGCDCCLCCCFEVLNLVVFKFCGSKVCNAAFMTAAVLDYYFSVIPIYLWDGFILFIL